MNILGIGPLEILLILVVALIVIGPKDMAKTGLTLGRWLGKIARSEEWRVLNKIARDIKTAPNRLIREAGLEEFKQLKNDLSSVDPLKPFRDNRLVEDKEYPDFSAWINPPLVEPGFEGTSSSLKDEPEPTNPPQKV